MDDRFQPPSFPEPSPQPNEHPVPRETDFGPPPRFELPPVSRWARIREWLLIGLILCVLVGAGIGIASWLDPEKRRIERQLEQGLRQNNLQVQSVDLQRKGPGEWAGTITDQAGNVRSVAYVRRTADRIEWLVRPTQAETEAKVRKLAEQIGAQVGSIKLQPAADGPITGQLETPEGIIYEIIEKIQPSRKPGGLPQLMIYMQLSPSSYPDWLRILKKAEDGTELKPFQMRADGEKRWIGESSDQVGNRYELTVELKPGPPPEGVPAEAADEILEHPVPGIRLLEKR